MRAIAIFTVLLAASLELAACGEGQLDAECDDEAYSTCADEYNDCAAGDGQCYLTGGVDQACLDGCFSDYCLCLDDHNCELEGSNCEAAL